MDLRMLGKTSRVLPQPSADNTDDDVRTQRYGEITVGSIIPTKHLLAEEGTYFVATNPTPGTAFAYTVQASFSDTVPFIYVYNKDTAGNSSAKRVSLDYIKIVVTVAAASGVQAHYAVITDNVSRAIGTNNTTTVTPVSPNMDAGNNSVCQINAQNSATASAITASSAAKRVVARGSFGGVTIIGDELVILFGSPDIGSYAGLTAAQATCPGRKCSSSPPVIIGPNSSATVHLWFPSNATTGLSYELEMGLWER